jgi:transposase
MAIAALLNPSLEDRSWLRKHAGSAVAPRRLVERCQIILRSAEGETNEQIAQALGLTRQKVARWRGRFAAGGRAGLEQDAPGRGRKPAYGPELQALIVERTLRSRPPQATQWSVRTLAKTLDLSFSTVARVWRAHGLKPHLVRTFKVIGMLIEEPSVFSFAKAARCGLFKLRSQPYSRYARSHAGATFPSAAAWRACSAHN